MPHKKTREKTLTCFLFTLPALVLYTMFLVFPVSQGFIYSFMDWSGLSKPHDFVGLKNYTMLFTDSRIINSFLFTFRYALILVIAILLFATTLALILHQVIKGKQRTFFRSVFFFPAVLSAITVGMTWNEIFYRVIPAIGSSLGIERLSVNILGDPKLAIYGLLIIHIWQGLAIPFVLILSGLQNIPVELYEAASIDGASPFQAFYRITIPFLLPVMNVVFVLVLKSGIMVYDYISATTGGGPANSTESIAVLIYQLSYRSLKMSYALSLSIVALCVIILVSVLQMKASSRVEVDQL